MRLRMETSAVAFSPFRQRRNASMRSEISAPASRTGSRSSKTAATSEANDFFLEKNIGESLGCVPKAAIAFPFSEIFPPSKASNFSSNSADCLQTAKGGGVIHDNSFGL